MLGDLVEWLLNLDREFAFLLALPFLVAFAGLLSQAMRRRKGVATEGDQVGAYRVRHEQHAGGG